MKKMTQLLEHLSKSLFRNRLVSKKRHNLTDSLRRWKSISSELFSFLFSLSKICFEQKRDFNSNRAVVTRVKRSLYSRLYPTTLVNPDGSTVRIKYPTPRILVKLPLDFNKLDPEMQRKVRLLRQPTGNKEKIKEIKVAFDPLKYVKNKKWLPLKLCCSKRQNF